MKGSEITQEGFYWCTHDLGMWLAPGSKYPVGWNVVEYAGGGIWLAGAGIETHPGDVPDYVTFTGPLEPPA